MARPLNSTFASSNNTDNNNHNKNLKTRDQRIDILQINMAGIISPTNMTTKQKCDYLLKIMNKHNTDIVLIQEWSLLRKKFTTQDKHYTDNNNIKHSLKFPIEHFYNYKVHHIGTETAVLYHKILNITPLPIQTDYDNDDRKKNCHITSIILHVNKQNIGIHSVYNSSNNNPSQMFKYLNIEDTNIYAGDFNTQHPHWGSTKTTNSANDFLDQLGNTDLKILNHDKSNHTHVHKSTETKTNIDLTLISDSIKCTKWQILENQYNRNFSDHIPIVTTIQITSKYGYDNTHKTWNLNNEKKWKKFRKLFKTKTEGIYFNEDTDIHATEICKLITETAEETIGYKYYYHGHKPWWNKSLKKLKTHTKRVGRKLQRIRKSCKNKNQIPTNKPSYIKAQKTLHKLYKLKSKAVRHAKTEYNNSLNSYIANSQNYGRKFWKSLEINKKTTRKNIPPLNTNTQKNITDPSQKVHALHNAMTLPPDVHNSGKHNEHYNEVNNFVNKYINNPNDPEFTKYKKNIIINPITKINEINDISNPNHIYNDNESDQIPSHNILNDPIKEYEIINAIHSLDNYKALGPDKVHNQMIKNAGETLIKLLISLFNKILDNSTFPSDWGLTHVLPIPKPNKNHSNPKNYS